MSDLHWAPHFQHDLRVVSEALLQDVDNYCSKNGISINAVIFSGDLALGGDDPAWFKGAYENFLVPISQQLDVPMERVFVAPGNHDISRELVRKIPSIHRGLAEKLTSNQAINRVIDTEHEDGSETAQSLGRMKNFYAEHDERHPTHSGTSPYFRTGTFAHGDRTVGVACLNSAWMATGESEDSDHRKLVLGERAVDMALADLEGCDFKIAVHHHPLDWLHPTDADAVDLLLRRSFDLSCSGHVHQSKPRLTMDGSGCCIASPTGSVFAGREWFNGYQIVEIDIPDRRYTFHVREYFDNRREFDRAVRVAENGLVEFQNPVLHDRSRIDKVESFLQGSRGRVRECLESQMTLVGDDETKPNLRIDDFVAPPLIEGRANSIDGSGSDAQDLSIESFLSRTDNAVVIGSRHSGKTTLAYYSAYMLAYGPGLIPQIPVVIDTRNFRFNPYSIRGQLGELYERSLSNPEAKAYAAEGIFTFLFDNCSCGEESFKKIADFAEEYPDCRCLVFASPNMDGVSPDRHFNEHLPNFTKIHIGALTRGRIRALSRQWSNGDRDGDATYETVINQLVRDGLPRTPYMVSLLIWAIQQKKELVKINEALLLQNMMDHLLGKADFKQSVRKVLNPVGKEITLQNFAYFIRSKGSVVDENEANEFLIAFFKRKALPFIGSDVLEKLIERGILHRRNGKVAFKYEAFEEYFYAKHLQSNRAELNVTLEGLNFLNFRRELELLAGLRPENADLISAIEKVLDSRVPDRFRKCNIGEFDRISGSELDIQLTKADLGQIRRTRLTNEKVDKMLDEADRRALARGERTVRESLERAKGNVRTAAEEREAESISKDQLSDSMPIRPSTHMAAIDLLARIIRNSDFTDYDSKGPATKRVLDSWTKIFLLIMDELGAMLAVIENDEGEKIPDKETESIKYLLAKFIFSNIGAALIHHMASPTMADTLHALIEEGEFTTGEHLLTLFLLEDIDDESWMDLWIEEIEKKDQSGFVIDSFVQRLLSLTYTKALDTEQEKRVHHLVDRIEKKLGWTNEKKSEVIQQMQKARDLRQLEQRK